jgi:hypothetical protein
MRTGGFSVFQNGKKRRKNEQLAGFGHYSECAWC